MAFTMATPAVLTDPGALFWAPVGTPIPASGVGGTIVASKFSDSWLSPWVPLGATLDGSEFTYDLKVEAIEVAEFFDPIKWATTKRTGTFGFTMADYTLSKLAKALNTPAPTIVSGTGATQLNKLAPVPVGNEVRAMIGWESLDFTVRIIAYQCINSGQIKSTFKKAPSLSGIACMFNLELPAATQPFEFYSAGAVRA